MKKFLIALAVLTISLSGQSQFIHGSIQKNADPTKTNIVLQSTYTSSPSEYIQYFQFAVAIPFGVSGGVTATAVGVNNFQDMGGELVAITPYHETSHGADEMVFGWIFLSPNEPPTNHYSWSSGVNFTGVTITFSSAAAAAEVKMLNLTNTGDGGGSNINTFFVIVSNLNGRDHTDYGNLFFAIPGASQLGNYVTNDQFLRTIATSPTVICPPNSTAKMQVQGYPNPSKNDFSLRLKTRDNEEVTIRILDISGKTMQVLKGTPDQFFKVGDQLLPGTYIADVRQGTERTMVKLVKLQ